MTDTEWLKVFYSAFAKYCYGYNVSLPELETIMVLMDGHLLQVTVNFVLTVPPYSTCRIENRLDSDHDVSSKQENIELNNVFFKTIHFWQLWSHFLLLSQVLGIDQHTSWNQRVQWSWRWACTSCHKAKTLWKWNKESHVRPWKGQPQCSCRKNISAPHQNGRGALQSQWMELDPASVVSHIH